MSVIKTFVFALVLFSLSSCKSSSPKFYGEPFDTTIAVGVKDMMVRVEDQGTIDVVVKGKVTSSCKDDGCWLNLENPDGKEIYVEWDEKFHLPLDISGKTVIVNGYAYIDSSQAGNPVAFKASGVKL
jgi:hypothetical protein